MHKPLLVSLSSGASPGHLAEVAEALGSAEPSINIGAVGGAEWENRGAIILYLDDDTDKGDIRDEARRIIEGLNYRTRPIESVTVELPHVPGSLGRAARRLADANINVEGVLVVGSRGPNALVSFGVDESDLQAAKNALSGFPQLAD